MPREIFTAQRIDYARELCREAIASVLYDPAPVLLDLRIDHFPKVGLEPFVRPLLILAHQARVARHISGEDRGETAGLAHQGATTTAVRASGSHGRRHRTCARDRLPRGPLRRSG